MGEGRGKREEGDTLVNKNNVDEEGEGERGRGERGEGRSGEIWESGERREKREKDEGGGGRGGRRCTILRQKLILIPTKGPSANSNS